MAIESARLRYVRFAAEHEPLFRALALDPQMTRLVGSGEPWTAERAERTARVLSEHWQRAGFGAYALYLKESGEFCGLISLVETDKPWLIEIGWWIAAGFWGLGLATEAAAVGCQIAAGIGAKAIVARCREDNIGSQRVATKIGMQHAGHLQGSEQADSMLWIVFTDDEGEAALTALASDG